MLTNQYNGKQKRVFFSRGSYSTRIPHFDLLQTPYIPIHNSQLPRTYFFKLGFASDVSKKISQMVVVFPIKRHFSRKFWLENKLSSHFLVPGKLSQVLLKVVLLTRRLHPIIGSKHRSYHSSLLTVQWVKLGYGVHAVNHWPGLIYLQATQNPPPWFSVWKYHGQKWRTSNSLRICIPCWILASPAITKLYYAML